MSLFLGSKSSLNRMERPYLVPEDNELLAQKQYPKVWFYLDRIHPVKGWQRGACGFGSCEVPHSLFGITAADGPRIQQCWMFWRISAEPKNAGCSRVGLQRDCARRSDM